MTSQSVGSHRCGNLEGVSGLGLKQLAASKELKVGNFIVEFATPGIGHILKEAGLDFAFFDMEHSGFGFETLKSAIRYFEAAGIPVIVRVPALENDMLARACDMGAEGLIAPMISTLTVGLLARIAPDSAACPTRASQPNTPAKIYAIAPPHRFMSPRCNSPNRLQMPVLLFSPSAFFTRLLFRSCPASSAPPPPPMSR